jgi:hypothetical protein
MARKLLLIILLFVFLFLYLKEVNADKVIVIPSDYKDYDFIDKEHYELNGQMRDESFVDYKHREIYLEEDLKLNGIFIEENEYEE